MWYFRALVLKTKSHHWICKDSSQAMDLVNDLTADLGPVQEEVGEVIDEVRDDLAVVQEPDERRRQGPAGKGLADGGRRALDVQRALRVDRRQQVEQVAEVGPQLLGDPAVGEQPHRLYRATATLEDGSTSVLHQAEPYQMAAFVARLGDRIPDHRSEGERRTAQGEQP